MKTKLLTICLLLFTSQAFAGKVEGLETQWYESGVKKSEIIFKNSIATKQQKYWSKNGLLLDAKSLNDFQQNKKFSH